MSVLCHYRDVPVYRESYTLLAVTLFSRSTLILADAIVISVTWYKLCMTSGVLGKNTLSNILLVDGKMCKHVHNWLMILILHLERSGSIYFMYVPFADTSIVSDGFASFENEAFY